MIISNNWTRAKYVSSKNFLKHFGFGGGNYTITASGYHTIGTLNLEFDKLCSFQGTVNGKVEIIENE